MRMILLFATLFFIIELWGADFAGGNGTKTNPYLISNREQLDNLRKYLGPAHIDKYYRLTADIDLSGSNWVPVGGSRDNAFQGKLNGAGHKISNLNIGLDGIGYYYTGLFGYLYNGADIDSLHIASGTILGAASEKSYTGAIAGYVYNSGSGSNVIYIWNCSNSANIRGGGTSESNTGGIVGYAYSSSSGYVYINRCTNNGAIFGGEAANSYTGGIMGRAQAYSSGTVRILRSINNAGITGDGTNFSCTGGMVGFGTETGLLSVQDNKNNGYILGGAALESNTGGFIGYGHGACACSYNENNANVTGRGTNISRTAGIVGCAEAAGSNNFIISYCENWGVIKEESPEITYTAGIVGMGETYFDGGYVYNTAELNIEKSMNYGNIHGGSSRASYTGGILGWGSSRNITEALGLRTSLSVNNCYNQSFVFAEGGCAGGLVGEINTNYSQNDKSTCKVEKCYASGKILGNAHYAGGLIGYADRKTYIGLSNCASLLTEIKGEVAHRIAGNNNLTLVNNYADNNMLVNGNKIISSDGGSPEGLDKPLSDFYKQSIYQSLDNWNFTDTEDGVWAIRSDNSSLPYFQFQAAPVIPVNFTSSGIQLDLAEPSDMVYVYRFTSDNGLEYLRSLENLPQGIYNYTFDFPVNPTDTLGFITFHSTESKWSPSYPTFAFKGSDTGIDKANDMNIRITPNPVVESFCVYGISNPAGLIIRDISGRLILSREIMDGESVSLSSQPQGIYFLILNVEGKTYMEKIIKK